MRGDYDIPDEVHGVTVLDLGTSAGWFAHYFWQRGAQVKTFDARGYCDFDVYGRWFYPPVEENAS